MGAKLKINLEVIGREILNETLETAKELEETVERIKRKTEELNTVLEAINKKRIE